MLRLRALGLALALLPIAFVGRAQNWELDPAFILPTLESGVASENTSMRLRALPDGGVLVTNPSAFVNGRRSAGLIRLFPNGAVDETYAPPTFSGALSILHVYPDGRALVADGDRQIVRLLPNGSVDASFLPTDFRATFTVTGVAGPAGIYVWGNFTVGGQTTTLALLRPDGGWDERFSRGAVGKLFIVDAALQPDGKLVVAGDYEGLDRVVFRLLTDGAIDSTFNAVSYSRSSAGFAQPTAVAVRSDGRIVVGSTSQVAVLQSNGAIDPAVRPDSPVSGTYRIGRASTSGSFYFASLTGTGTRVQRFTDSGILDPAFLIQTDSAGAPRLELPTSWDDRVVFFANSLTTARQVARQRVTRVTGSGTVDAAFACRFSDLASVSLPLRQPDGKYLVSGSFDFVGDTPLPTQRTNLVRLNANGSVDSGFRPPREAVSSSAVHANSAIAVQPDGHILVSTGEGVRRLDRDGTLDPGFPATRDFIGMDSDGYVYLRLSGGPIRRSTPAGVPDPTYSAPALANTAAGATILPKGGYLVQTLDGSGGPRFSWLRSDGTVTGELSFSSFASSGVRAVLPDGSVMFFTNENTAATNINAVRVSHYGTNGALLLRADVASDAMTVAAVVHDAMATRGEGTTSVDLTQLRPRASVSVAHGEVLVTPDPVLAAYRTALPFGRFRPKLASEPMLSLSPTIYLQPANVNFVVGGSPSFTVGAWGAGPMTYQWFRDGIPLAPAREVSGNSDRLSIRDAQVADTGVYTVRITNAYGATVSQGARLAALAPPAMVRMPVPQLNVAPAQTVAVTISTSGDGMRYGYVRNGSSYGDPSDPGVLIPGGTFTLLLPDVTAADAGTYRIRASDGRNGAESTETVISVRSGVPPSRLANVSVRTRAGTGDRSLIVGFVVGGDGSTGPALLARAIGPGLTAFGVSGALADPQLTLFSGSVVVAANDDWDGNADVAAAGGRVGAFALPANSRDAALYRASLPAGAYTLQVVATGSATGIALAELYDASPTEERGTRQRLINLSTRAEIEADGVGLIGGFVIAGELAKTVLVRAVGPSLGRLGVTGFLASGTLTIMDGRGQVVAENLTRGYESAPDRLAEKVGAFPLVGGANDNAIAITLPPGPYTVHARGVGQAAGVALIEVYEVP